MHRRTRRCFLPSQRAQSCWTRLQRSDRRPQPSAATPCARSSTPSRHACTPAAPPGASWPWCRSSWRKRCPP
eukprot:UN2188